MKCPTHKQKVLTVKAPKFQDNCYQRCFLTTSFDGGLLDIIFSNDLRTHVLTTLTLLPKTVNKLNNLPVVWSLIC